MIHDLNRMVVDRHELYTGYQMLAFESQIREFKVKHCYRKLRKQKIYG